MFGLVSSTFTTLYLCVGLKEREEGRSSNSRTRRTELTRVSFCSSRIVSFSGSALGFFIPKPCISHARDLYIPPPPPTLNSSHTQLQPPTQLTAAQRSTYDLDLHPGEFSSGSRRLPFDSIYYPPQNSNSTHPNPSSSRRTHNRSSSSLLVNPSTAPLWAFRAEAVHVQAVRRASGKGKRKERNEEEVEGGEGGDGNGRRRVAGGR